MIQPGCVNCVGSEKCKLELWLWPTRGESGVDTRPFKRRLKVCWRSNWLLVATSFLSTHLYALNIRELVDTVTVA